MHDVIEGRLLCKLSEKSTGSMSTMPTCVVVLPTIPVLFATHHLKRKGTWVTHRRVVIHTDPIKDTAFICRICLIAMKLNADLKSHIRSHGCRNEMEAIASDAKAEEAAPTCIRCGYQHVCIYENVSKIKYNWYCCS